MGSSPWLESLEKVLRKQGTPVFEADSDTGVPHILSAANLWTRALEKKRALSRLGFKPGHILVESSHSPDFLINFVACSMAAGRFWPVSPADYDHLLQTPDLINKYSLVSGDGKKLTYPVECDTALDLLGEDCVLILKTSGSSGVSKLVGVSGNALLHQIENFNSAMAIEAQSGRLIVLPLHHCFGFILDLLAGIFARQTIFLRSHHKLNYDQIFSLLGREDITYLSVVPRMLELLLLSAKQDPVRLSQLRRLRVHVGGARLSESLRTRAKAVLGQLIEGYGLTECAGGVMLNGRPNGCEVRLKSIFGLNSDASELWIKTPALGTFLNVELDSDGYFNSGDLARTEVDGRLEILGRRGEFFKDQSGLFVNLELVRQRVSSAIGIDVLGLSLHKNEFKFILKSLDQQKIELINSYLDKHFAYKASFEILESPHDISKILLESSRKSSEEALSDWAGKRQPCA